MPGGALEGEERRITSGRSTAGRVTSYFVGSKLDEHRGAFLLEYPMERGRVVDGGWDAMELLWEVRGRLAVASLFLGYRLLIIGFCLTCGCARTEYNANRVIANLGQHIYSKQNLNAKMDEHPVLLTEPPLNPTSHREQMAQIFFETYRAPALFVAPPAVLSLYASGRTTGVVLDVGHGVTHCIPVYEGYALPHSIVRSDVAGADVSSRLQALLRKSGLALGTTAETDFVHTMKEQVCYVNGVPVVVGGAESDPRVGGSSDPARAQYQLPDGQVVDLSTERYHSSEVLFNPSLIGSEEKSIQDVLLTSINRSDMDLRSTLYSNIVLSGGSTLTPGLGDRLLSEIRSKAPERTRIRINAPPERTDSAWVGGSVLASLATFKNMWVSRREYEEHGPSILHKGAL